MTSPRTMPGGIRTWSPEMDEALKRHIADKLSHSKVFELINREFKTTVSRNATIGRAFRLGLKSEARPVKKCITVVKRSPRPIRRHPMAKLFALEPQLERAEVVLQCAAVEPLNIGLMDLRENHCRYPYGKGPYTFCGHEKQAKSSYCHLHTKLCDGRGTAAERAAAPIGNLRSARPSAHTFEAA